MLLCQFLVLVITTGKKVLVVCLAGCAVVSVFGSGDYDRKKSSSRLSGGLWCNEFVLVLAKIDLISFENSICISSTWIKTNTNPLVQLQHFRYIIGQYIQFRVKLDMWYKSYHINLYIKGCRYSSFIWSMKTKTNTEISFSFWLTLFYSIPLLALMDGWTDGRTDRQRVKYTRFAWAGGTCPRFAWAGGTFFPVVLLYQFLVLAITTGKKVLVVYLAGCAVVSVFGSGDYDRKKKF